MAINRPSGKSEVFGGIVIQQLADPIMQSHTLVHQQITFAIMLCFVLSVLSSCALFPAYPEILKNFPDICKIARNPVWLQISLLCVISCNLRAKVIDFICGMLFAFHVMLIRKQELGGKKKKTLRHFSDFKIFYRKPTSDSLSPAGGHHKPPVFRTLEFNEALSPASWRYVWHGEKALNMVHWPLKRRITYAASH